MVITLYKLTATLVCAFANIADKMAEAGYSGADSHYEWCTDIIGQNGELAWSIGERPQIEEVNEKVSIMEHCPEIGTVYLAEPDEVGTLVVEALRRGEIGQR